MSSHPVTRQPSKDPLHGVTLEMMLKQLVAHEGWEEMAFQVPIRCFQNEPSLTSSLRFLRRTPWARKKVEKLYLRMLAREKPGKLACPPMESKRGLRN